MCTFVHIDTPSVKNLGHVFIIKLPQKVFILYIASVCIPVFTLEKNILRRLKIKTTFVVFYNFFFRGGRGTKISLKKERTEGRGYGQNEHGRTEGGRGSKIGQISTNVLFEWPHYTIE